MMMMPVRNKGQVQHPLAIIKERNKMWIKKDMGCKKKGSFHQLVGCAGGVSHTLT
jgi:hypothetical protein